jgi:hypothetical protein
VDRTNRSDFAKAARAPNPAGGIILISSEALFGGFSRTIGVDTSDVPTSLMPAAPQNEPTCGKSGDPTTARYLQLKSGHAVTGAHLLRIVKVKDAQCWWCGGSGQTVAHLLLRCRKWRRQRASMMRGLRVERVFISASRDGADLDSLCRE